MKIDNLKVQKDYSKGKISWGIFGRKIKGTWELCELNGKNLLFDLKYDACVFLAALYEETTDKGVRRKGYGYQSHSEESLGR